MRVRLLAAAAAALIAALALAGRWTGPAAAPPDPQPAAAPMAPAGAELAGPGADETPRLLRDPFRYADAPLPTAAPPEPRLTPAAEPAAAPEPPVRLVGFIRQAGGARAALAIAGEVVLLRPGESAGGWTLESLDEEGARLSGPDGREEALTLPE